MFTKKQSRKKKKGSEIIIHYRFQDLNSFLHLLNGKNGVFFYKRMLSNNRESFFANDSFYTAQPKVKKGLDNQQSSKDGLRTKTSTT